jgi:hypothetical protein
MIQKFLIKFFSMLSVKSGENDVNFNKNIPQKSIFGGLWILDIFSKFLVLGQTKLFVKDFELTGPLGNVIVHARPLPDILQYFKTQKCIISAILEVFFDKNLPLFLTKTNSKKQNCG